MKKLARLVFEYDAARCYKEGKLALREASSLLNLTLSETIDLLIEMGVKGNIRAGDVTASLRSLDLSNPERGKGG